MNRPSLLLISFVISFSCAVWAQPPETSSQVKHSQELAKLDREIHRTDLLLAAEKQSAVLAEARDRLKKSKEAYQRAEQALRQREKELARFSEGNSANRGIYYKETQAKPISRSGHFYEQVLAEKNTAESNCHRAKKNLTEAERNVKKELRLLAEAKQRLADYDQAEAEHWPNNPF